MLERYFHNNEFLFWILGLSIAVISIIYGINADVFRSYGYELPWKKEFLQKQLLLEKISSDAANVNFTKYANDILDLRGKSPYNKEFIYQHTKESDLNSIPVKTLIIVDRTESATYSLSKILDGDDSIDKFYKGKARKYIDDIINNKANENISIDEDNFYSIKDNKIEYKLSAPSIITLSLINSLINNDNKSDNDNQLALAYYYTENELTLINQDHENGLKNSSIKWESYSKYKEDQEYLNLLKNIVDKDYNSVPVESQSTSFPKLIKNIKEQIIGKINIEQDYSYHIILISDFIDDILKSSNEAEKNRYYLEVKKALNGLNTTNNLVQFTNIQLAKKPNAYKGIDINNQIAKLKSVFKDKFSAVNYYSIDTDENEIFQQNPILFSKIYSQFTTFNKDNNSLVLYEDFQSPNFNDVAIGFIKNENKIYEIKSKSNVFNENYNLYFSYEGEILSNDLQSITTNKTTFKDSSGKKFINIVLPDVEYHKSNSSLFLSSFDEENYIRSEKPILIKGRLNFTYLYALIFFLILITSTTLTLIYRFVYSISYKMLSFEFYSKKTIRISSKLIAKFFILFSIILLSICLVFVINSLISSMKNYFLDLIESLKTLYDLYKLDKNKVFAIFDPSNILYIYIAIPTYVILKDVIKFIYEIYIDGFKLKNV